MSPLQYIVPDFLQGHCDQKKYSRWLQRKAAAHVKRDRKRDRECAVAQYKAAIHAAVCESQGKDFYTGELLDWSLVSTWNNDSAKIGRVTFKKSFALLPTIDHTLDEHGKSKFVICSWYVNDVKSDLTLPEFYRMCELALKYRDERTPGQS
jgi:hypothetical protein